MAVLAIDQGTTSSRAILFDEKLRPAKTGQYEFAQHFPHSGWVEHDAEEIWATTLQAARDALKDEKPPAALGVTNQRETVVVWDRRTGKPIHRALVWQDRRVAERCAALRAEGAEPLISERTGLLLDPYFSALKAAWILDHVEGARARAEKGELLFGTIDSWLIWNLTGGRVHATDATNASRTMLYDIRKGRWDEELCRLLGVPMVLLPEVKDCADDFGTTDPAILGAAIPIRGVAGDQQAAAIGQACFAPGMMKSTYGTGCFALLNTGAAPAVSRSRLLTTVAWRLKGETSYALEGSIFIAGAVAQWLRDGLKIVKSAAETQSLAEAADPEQSLYLVPAFTGLGAPWWDSEARGAIFGLTRNSGPAEFARAALEAVGYQTRDLWEAMRADWPEAAESVLRVDGGMAANDWAMQFLSDILDAPVDRPRVLETTALGAAWLAGSQAGVAPDQAAFAREWALERRFEPRMGAEDRDRKYAGWRDAVRRTLTASKA